MCCVLFYFLARLFNCTFFVLQVRFPCSCFRKDTNLFSRFSVKSLFLKPPDVMSALLSHTSLRPPIVLYFFVPAIPLNYKKNRCTLNFNYIFAPFCFFCAVETAFHPLHLPRLEIVLDLIYCAGLLVPARISVDLLLLAQNSEQCLQNQETLLLMRLSNLLLY